ncbi:hypothetical protein [Mycobacteroides abscessus]|uniref:hypothetical protein n=1 Tax=Mycobacteroides abscessus TaxID=36809 RepID=UPI0018787076|nr:hypothetical protein [Mycobacteroides abscessus]
MSKTIKTLTSAETLEAIDRLAAQAYAATVMYTCRGTTTAAEHVPHSDRWQSLRHLAAERLAYQQYLIDALGPGFTREQELAHRMTVRDEQQLLLSEEAILAGAPVTREAVRRVGKHQARHAAAEAA